MRTIAIVMLLLAGCDEVKPAPGQWKCIGGITYERVNGAWVLLEGHYYINFPDGPIKCAT